MDLIVKRSVTTPRTRQPRPPRIEKRKEATSYGPPRIVCIDRLVYQFNYAC